VDRNHDSQHQLKDTNLVREVTVHNGDEIRCPERKIQSIEHDGSIYGTTEQLWTVEEVDLAHVFCQFHLLSSWSESCFLSNIFKKFNFLIGVCGLLEFVQLELFHRIKKMSRGGGRCYPLDRTHRILCLDLWNTKGGMIRERSSTQQQHR
jgi:hypothetical protein